MKLLGWDIAIRRVRAESDCPICIMETLREFCLERRGDRFMPRHAMQKPYGVDWYTVCGMGDACKCLRQAEALRGRFGK